MIVIVSTKEPYKSIEFDFIKLKSIVDSFIAEATPNLSGKYKIEFVKENLMVSPIINMKHFYCYKYSLVSQDKPMIKLSLYATFDEGDVNFNLYVGREVEQAAILINSLYEILNIESVNSALGNPSHRFVYTYSTD